MTNNASSYASTKSDPAIARKLSTSASAMSAILDRRYDNKEPTPPPRLDTPTHPTANTQPAETSSNLLAAKVGAKLSVSHRNPPDSPDRRPDRTLLTGLHRTPWTVLWKLVIRRFRVQVPGGVPLHRPLTRDNTRSAALATPGSGPGCQRGCLTHQPRPPVRLDSLLSVLRRFDQLIFWLQDVVMCLRGPKTGLIRCRHRERCLRQLEANQRLRTSALRCP